MSRSYPLLMLGIAEAATFVIIASLARRPRNVRAPRETEAP